MKTNEELFNKYNPEEDVARCPYGRAKVRDLLHDYACAAVNLYGVIPLEDLVEIFNEQTEYETNVEELYIMLLPLVFKDKAYVFYKNNLGLYGVSQFFEKADSILMNQKGKPRYVPAKEEFLNYMDESYNDNPFGTQLIDQLIELKVKPSEIMDLYYQLEAVHNMNEGMELLKNNGVHFDSKATVESFMTVYNDWHNNLRLWDHKGHRSAYFHELNVEQEAEIKEEKSENIVEIATPKKIGRNEPCPCGRGKKFKKCCLSYDIKQTAQLSSQDKELFFEIYFSLLDYVNQKARLIDFRFDYDNPQHNSSQMMYPIRQFLIENPEIISQYLKATDLSPEKKEILESWEKHYVEKDYMIVDYKNEYAVLLEIGKEEAEEKLYGVKGISHSLATAMLRPLPLLISTVVLPFKDQLIYDYFAASQNVAYGSNIKQTVNENYQSLMDKEGIISSFD